MYLQILTEDGVATTSQNSDFLCIHFSCLMTECTTSCTYHIVIIPNVAGHPLCGSSSVVHDLQCNLETVDWDVICLTYLIQSICSVSISNFPNCLQKLMVVHGLRQSISLLHNLLSTALSSGTYTSTNLMAAEHFCCV